MIAAAATASDASAAITIDGTGPASPYPSATGLTGLGPMIEDVDVRLNNGGGRAARAVSIKLRR